MNRPDPTETIEAIINTGYDVLSEWLQKKNDDNPQQSWSLIKKEDLIRIWTQYSRFGFVRDENAILNFQGIIIENIGKLYANTIFMGHDSISPKNHAEWLGFDDITNQDFEGFEDFITDRNGTWRISDYAIDKLATASIALAQARTPEEKLLAMDHVLNVVHYRSDLASWFVEGGTRTLTELQQD